MSEKKTGGPAFPYSALQPDARGLAPTMYTDNCGMTLRDYFAASSLMLFGAGILTFKAFMDVPVEQVPHVLAREAYAVADAMLAERDT